mmetsp:Transcript_118640/g.205120  ORF Transcript_118640/g.205120 Transcript_118640/m.205120 type:complete len:219 (-) Transcript_118640:836-1492(-)
MRPDLCWLKLAAPATEARQEPPPPAVGLPTQLQQRMAVACLPLVSSPLGEPSQLAGHASPSLQDRPYQTWDRQDYQRWIPGWQSRPNSCNHLHRQPFPPPAQCQYHCCHQTLTSESVATVPVQSPMPWPAPQNAYPSRYSRGQVNPGEQLPGQALLVLPWPAAAPWRLARSAARRPPAALELQLWSSPALPEALVPWAQQALALLRQPGSQQQLLAQP